MAPTISVIIPTYNRANLLSQAIDSLLCQSFQDFELIVVDDGSQDNTRTAVGRYSEPRLRYIFQENQGLGAARNTGIAIAQGKFVAFLDSDDFLFPNGLSYEIEAVEKDPEIGLVAGGYVMVDNSGQALAARKPWFDCPELDLTSALPSLPVVPSGVIVRKAWLERVGGFARLQPMGAEDSALWLQLAYHGCRMVWTKHLVCAYRIHSGQMVGNGRSQKESALAAIGRFFTQPSMPSRLLQERDRINARVWLSGAFREYSSNQLEDARQSLARAIELDPAWIEGDVPPAADALVGWAANPVTGDPAAYIQRVLDHLPSSAGRLRDFEQRLYYASVIRSTVDAIQVNNFTLASSYLAQVEKLGHALSENRDLLVELVEEAVRSYETEEQETVIKQFFDSLPLSAIPHRATLRRRTLGRLHMKRSFDSLAEGDRGAARWSAWRGVSHDPSWLRNRGVWSIFLRPLSPRTS